MTSGALPPSMAAAIAAATGAARQGAAEVAGGVHRGGAVGAELGGDGVGVSAAVHGLDGVAELAGLGEQFECGRW